MMHRSFQFPVHRPSILCYPHTFIICVFIIITAYVKKIAQTTPPGPRTIQTIVTGRAETTSEVRPGVCIFKYNTSVRVRAVMYHLN